jgi:arabinose-5-phosphate isomerase
MSQTEADIWLQEGRRVLGEAAAALTTLADRLDPDSWTRAVALILSSSGRVVVTGMGKSAAVGRKLASTLASTGTHALFLHPAEAVHGDLGMLAAGDVVIALSYSGETDEVRAILPGIGRLDVPIIAFTSNAHSTLAAQSAVILDVSIGKEACPMNLAPTTSTTAMIAMGDALAIAVMVARGFTADDFARLHPAGALGRRLTLRVSDVMRTGDGIAVVGEATTMGDTVLAITQAHVGAAIVTGRDGRVCGLIVDGDIRRHLLDGQDLLTRQACELMNPKPGLLTPDILAVEGLRMLGEFHPIPGNKVGEAPVVDSGGRPVGLLMLKDLVKAGLVEA